MSRNRSLVLAVALALSATALVVSTAPVAAGRPDLVVTLAGDLQSELGCSGDWQPDCAASRLADDGDGMYSATFDLPAGAYQFKVTIGGVWDENYGAGGLPNGPNIPVAVVGPATLLFEYDDDTHVISVSPTDLDATVTAADHSLAGDSLRNRLTREQFYFVMTDRFANGDTSNDLGGYTGDRLSTGYDPTDKGFYHGGDLAGLRDKLDYIKALGTTAIWLTPSFANKPVQGAPGQESAGYHGYWITDFTRIDPHMGTNAELEALIGDAHAMGMKVFFDIITNHTADVIDYAEGQYSYISKATEPYKTATGTPFDDRDFVNETFPPMDPATSFPYTPVFNSAADATAKTPAWLNNPIYYHNRGDSTFAGESAEYGDFIGLDDLFTERPEVEQGMEEIYKAWIDLGIDGFRIDTAKHVNLEFWQLFSPSMLEHAASVGTDDFFMFGEVFDANPAFQSIYSTAGTLPSTLDFGFQQAAVAFTNGKESTVLANMFAGDDYYTDADSNAYNVPTFLGNHDMGRIGRFVNGSLPRVNFANALMFTLRGQPVIYYGDEQGFIGDGGDKDARQDMFASQVPSYNDDPMLGTAPTGSRDRYGTNGEVFRSIAQLSRLRSSHRALQDGAQIPRFASDSAGIFAVTRVDAQEQIEYLVVANNSDVAKTATFATYTKNGKFRSIHGGGDNLTVGAEGQVTVTVPSLTVRVYRADRPIKRSKAAPAITLASPDDGSVLSGRAEIEAGVPVNQFTQVTFAYRPVGSTEWQLLGTDDNPTYRVFHDVSAYPSGTLIEYRAIAMDNAGHLSAAVSWGTVGTPPPPPPGGGVGDVVQPNAVAVAGTLNSDMGCLTSNGDPEDWAPWCDQAQLSIDANDKIWKGTYTLPAGPYSYKVALNRTWDENYGAGAVRDGANIDMTTDGSAVTFFYDHRTHWVTSTAQGDIVVAPGSFQSEMGCSGDWDPACMRSWLQDPDDDGVFTLSTTQIPAGLYEAKVALNRSWTVNYGQNGVPDGANIPFTVPDGNGVVTTFSYDSTSHVMTIGTSTASQPPDISVAEALWVDEATVAYPLDRLPAGSDPMWLRFRLHWGELAVDATTVGGESSGLTVAGTTEDGYVLLALDKQTAKRVDEIRAGPMVAVAVYDDAGRLLDATGVE